MGSCRVAVSRVGFAIHSLTGLESALLRFQPFAGLWVWLNKKYRLWGLVIVV